MGLAFEFDLGGECYRQPERTAKTIHRGKPHMLAELRAGNDFFHHLKTDFVSRCETKRYLTFVARKRLSENRIGLLAFRISMGAVEGDPVHPCCKQRVDQLAVFHPRRQAPIICIQRLIVDRNHRDVLRCGTRTQFGTDGAVKVLGRQRQVDRSRNQPEQDCKDRDLETFAPQQVSTRIQSVFFKQNRPIGSGAHEAASQESCH